MMRMLLDTHVFLWWVNGDRKISKSIKSDIINADEVYVSSASIWEAAIKIELKKLEADIDLLVDAISESGFIELEVSSEHAAAVCRLPNHHRDPFDRLLIAQSLTEPLIFLTADKKLQSYTGFVKVLS